MHILEHTAKYYPQYFDVVNQKLKTKAKINTHVDMWRYTFIFNVLNVICIIVHSSSSINMCSYLSVQWEKKIVSFL